MAVVLDLVGIAGRRLRGNFRDVGGRYHPAPMFRVLVIDDNPEVRELLQGILEGAGYAVDLASDGALGLILQRARPADAVIDGTSTPAQDGIETARRLRSEFPQLKIVALPQPLDPDRLLRELRETLR